MDPITGGAVLLFRPLKGMPPRIEVVGVLSYELPVEDAWVSELPFGVQNAAQYHGKAEMPRLEAWTRRLLVAFAELEAQGLRHGKLRPEDLWVRGEAVWVAGVGVPWPNPEPDAVRLVRALKALAGEGWEGWRWASVLESLAEGRLGFSEAIAALNEAPEAVQEIVPNEEKPAAPSPRPPEPPSAVRVKGKKTPARQPEPAPPPAAAKDDPPPEPAPAPAPGPEKTPSRPASAGEPPEVVRIGEPEDPAFEVVSPNAAGVDRRQLLRLLATAFLLVVLIAAGFWAFKSRGPSYVQEVFFEVAPEGESADLIVLSAPEGSRLASGTRMPIPGKVRFDKEGLYTFEVQSEGYKPKTFALEIPVIGGRVTVRLGNR